MTYVIAEPCVDVCDRACVEWCPVEVVYHEDDLPGMWRMYAGENVGFFAEPRPGRDEPLGSPGGAAKLSVAGAGTAFVAGLPSRR